MVFLDGCECEELAKTRWVTVSRLHPPWRLVQKERLTVKELTPPWAGSFTASLAEGKTPHKAQAQQLAGGAGLLLAVVRSGLA